MMGSIVWYWPEKDMLILEEGMWFIFEAGKVNKSFMHKVSTKNGFVLESILYVGDL